MNIHNISNIFDQLPRTLVLIWCALSIPILLIVNKFIQIKKQKKISNIFNSGILRSIRLNNKDKSKYNLIILCTGKNSNLSKKFFSKGIIEKSYNEISVTTTLSHAYTKNTTARRAVRSIRYFDYQNSPRNNCKFTK